MINCKLFLINVLFVELIPIAIRIGIKKIQCPQNNCNSLLPYPQIKCMKTLNTTTEIHIERSNVLDLTSPQIETPKIIMTTI